MDHDTVLNILKNTNSHEGVVERVQFDAANGTVQIEILQPDEHYQYPDHSLTLTFNGVARFTFERLKELNNSELLDIISSKEGELYTATFFLGKDAQSVASSLNIEFKTLSFDRC